jgi:hypothetical protein
MLILVCFSMPRGVYGQTADEGDAEAVQAPAESPQGKEAPDPSELAKLIIRRTNEFRQEEGLSTVEVNPKLTDTAQGFHSEGVGRAQRQAGMKVSARGVIAIFRPFPPNYSRWP